MYYYSNPQTKFQKIKTDETKLICWYFGNYRIDVNLDFINFDFFNLYFRVLQV